MSRPREPILLCAPGSGVGHVVRASALCLRLGEIGVPARIVTNSRYAEGLGRLTGCAIDRIPSARWREVLPGYVAARRPRLVVVDSFPWGLRGEWLGVRAPGVRFATLARRLRVEAYLAALGAAWRPAAPQLERIVVIEPLAGEHLRLLQESGGELIELAGRIRFPSGGAEPPAPAELERLLATGRLWLVVHSGSPGETDELVRRAGQGADAAGGSVAAIVPEPLAGAPCSCFEYFPASALFARAHRVVSGAGYNLVAEMAAHPGKHIAVPFPRRYDDQPARLTGPPAAPTDAGPQAARTLAEWL